MMFKIGADPEVFVFNNKTKRFVTGWGMVDGTKEHPTKVPFGAVQVDGMALEFNINPASSVAGFVRNINGVRYHLEKMIGPEFSLKSAPSIKFNKKSWEDAPDEAKILGCSPDFNAWEGGKVNVISEANKNSTLRTGAGHIHIGWNEGMDIEHPDLTTACLLAIKQLDCYLGIQSLLDDDDTRRRIIYGAAGAYRPKPYGVEYRVLSNYWLKSEAAMIKVYNGTQFALDQLMKGNFFFERGNFQKGNALYPPKILKAGKPSDDVKKLIGEELALINIGAYR